MVKAHWVKSSEEGIEKPGELLVNGQQVKLNRNKKFWLGNLQYSNNY